MSGATRGAGADGGLAVPILAGGDVVTARQVGRTLAAQLGFAPPDLTRIAAAISEMGRNVIQHAQRGVIHLVRVREGQRDGILVRVEDCGPGIADLRRAMQDGFTTRDGLGLGLPGARRLMDDFHIQTTPGRGTTVTMRKWKS